MLRFVSTVVKPLCDNLHHSNYAICIPNHNASIRDIITIQRSLNGRVHTGVAPSSWTGLPCFTKVGSIPQLSN